jgi:hypothetical protein
MCTVYGPGYALGLNPLLHFMAITNSDELARKSSLKCRDLITSPEFQSRFPHGLGVARESSWTLRAPGQDGNFSYLAAGVGGGMTGHGCDLLIVDDTIKSLPEAYSTTVRDKVWVVHVGCVHPLSPQRGARSYYRPDSTAMIFRAVAEAGKSTPRLRNGRWLCWPL